VAKERLKSPRVRLFVALDLPEAIREAIVAWQRAELEPVPELRVVPPGNLHVTLVFLGWQRERDIEPIMAALGDLGTQAPELAFVPEVAARGGTKSRPRLFALETSGEGAAGVQAEVEERLVSARFYEPEKRPFWSHVTVARVRAERRGSKRPALVSRWPGRLPEGLLSPFEAVRVRLYRSILRSQGAEYTPVAQIELPRGGEEVI
jgi:RNA 2',3'-cyclic 3'-phosphodiesterase